MARNSHTHTHTHTQTHVLTYVCTGASGLESAAHKPLPLSGLPTSPTRGEVIRERTDTHLTDEQAKAEEGQCFAPMAKMGPSQSKLRPLCPNLEFFSVSR